MNQSSHKQTSQAIEVFLRLALLIGLLYWCYQILSPFLLPVLWGLIIAVATYPVQQFLQPKLGNKQKVTAIIITVLLLSVILVPASFFVSSLADSLLSIKDQIEAGTLTIPTPQESIKEWPVIGNKLYDFLIMLTQNTAEFVKLYQTEITSISKSVLNTLVGTGLSVLQLLLSIIIAGVLLATKGTEEAAHLILNRLIHNQGKEFVTLSASTIRNVVKGVLGVAVIQSILLGIGGFMLFGFIGLFSGAIILSVGYRLFLAWLYYIETDTTTSSH